MRKAAGWFALVFLTIGLLLFGLGFWEGRNGEVLVMPIQLIAGAKIDRDFTVPFTGDYDVALQFSRALPHDRVLIETDTPYLAPVPFRGRDNEPAFVIKIAELLATLWEVGVEEVAARTTANFESAFGVRLRS